MWTHVVVVDLCIKNGARFWFQRSHVSPIPALIIAQEPFLRIPEKSVSESHVPKLKERRICRHMCDSSQKNRGATRSDPVRPEAPEPSQHKGRCGAPSHPWEVGSHAIVERGDEAEVLLCKSGSRFLIVRGRVARVHYLIGRAGAWHHRGSDSQTFGCKSAVGKLPFEAVGWLENPDS